MTMTESGGADLILASASASRRRLLQAAGVTFRVVPADIDETALKHELRASPHSAGVDSVASHLARAKALAVSGRHSEALVIGADQVLAQGEELFDKPRDRVEARAQLMRLRGRSHRLVSGVALAQGAAVVWEHCAAATLTMRAFSDRHLDHYLSAVGDAITRTVGAYELEGPGIQLFDRVDGEYFTILGLPLIPLLAELRARGALET